MPQEISANSVMLNTPSKNSRGLKALNSLTNGVEEFIDDRELAQRKAEAAGTFYFTFFTFLCRIWIAFTDLVLVG